MRRSLPDRRRFLIDDEASNERWRDDAQTFHQRHGVSPADSPKGFFRFRARQRGWNGGPNDGADRYPEHTREG